MAYLEKSRIVKTPIPSESRPWSYFKEHERAAIFEALQIISFDTVVSQLILMVS